tara:strand:- start:753 stop:917 length:165 start_codon:yes stop_codon:yes gene_type:complete
MSMEDVKSEFIEHLLNDDKDCYAEHYELTNRYPDDWEDFLNELKEYGIDLIKER